MFRGWKGIAIIVAVALALFAGAVRYAIDASPAPRGFSGLEFDSLTPAASARTPMLKRGGALVKSVMADSPAAKAGIVPGEVVAAIDGALIQTARQASDLVRAVRAGERATFTLYDITKGEVKPRDIALTFDAEPPVGKKLYVHPPRTLAKDPPSTLTVAANAAWSNRILRGPTIRPIPLLGLGDSGCNGFAPEGWKVAGHDPEGRTFHVMAGQGFAHAIHHSAAYSGDTEAYVRGYLEQSFGAPPLLSPTQDRPYGFVLQHFGNRKGGAGFVIYRLRHGRIVLWTGAVAGADASWGKPLVGAIALSMRCKAPTITRARGRDMPATSVSMACLKGACGESDLAATYLATLRKGYVHNLKGEMFLVNPRRDFWQSGAEGPGFYRQTGGENEKLLPGRIN